MNTATPKFSKHISEDWCHLCGERKPNTVDVWYSKNAENAPLDTSKYIRICIPCLMQMYEAAIK